MYKIEIEHLENEQVEKIDIVCESIERVIDFIEEMEKIHDVVAFNMIKKGE